MSDLLSRIDELLDRCGRFTNQEAFASIEEAFDRCRNSGSLSREEIEHYFGLVTLVLLNHARGGTVRFSGAGHAYAREAHLLFNDVYEAALDRTIEFLTRNFFRHLDEYEPHAYRMAVMRAFAKEYEIIRALRNGQEPLEVGPGSHVDAEAAEPDGSANDDGSDRFEPAAAETAPDDDGNDPDATIFHDWYVGSLSRMELSKLHRLTPGQVNAALLRHAGRAEQGRLYPLVAALVRMDDDGDIFLLASKGLTAEQIAEKIGRSRWVVHKHLQVVRKKFGRLRDAGEPGRKFVSWLLGIRPELKNDPDVLRVLHDHGPGLGVPEVEPAPAATS